jgi:hypothetical protein
MKKNTAGSVRAGKNIEKDGSRRFPRCRRGGIGPAPEAAVPEAAVPEVSLLKTGADFITVR